MSSFPILESLLLPRNIRNQTLTYKCKKCGKNLRKSNEIYNKQLQYNCLKQLPTLRLKKLENSGERKCNTQPAAILLAKSSVLQLSCPK